METAALCTLHLASATPANNDSHTVCKIPVTQRNTALSCQRNCVAWGIHYLHTKAIHFQVQHVLCAMLCKRNCSMQQSCMQSNELNEYSDGKGLLMH